MLANVNLQHDMEMLANKGRIMVWFLFQNDLTVIPFFEYFCQLLDATSWIQINSTTYGIKCSKYDIAVNLSIHSDSQIINYDSKFIFKVVGNRGPTEINARSLMMIEASVQARDLLTI